MAIVPNPNNASYPKLALGKVNKTMLQDAIKSLTDPTAGYSVDKCDGGMDRSQRENPGVNGLGDKAKRQTRVALAPLVLFGIAHLGAGPTRATGVDPSGRLTLPLPQTPMTFYELRALTNVGQVHGNWKWDSAGLDWVYSAKSFKPTKYESIWRGHHTRRGHVTNSSE